MKRRVYVARDPVDASLVQGVLESRGLATEMRGDALWGARGMIPMTTDTAPSLWVEERDFEQARALIEAAHVATPDAPAWTCARCGETVDAPLTECWSCGAPAPQPAS